MSIDHHPNSEILFDYASGALGETWSLGISTHLSLCPQCRKAISEMESIGGQMLEDVGENSVADDAFDTVLARLDAEPIRDEKIEPVYAGDRQTPILPQPLRGYVGGDIDDLPWQRLGLGAYQLMIPTDSDSVTARLLRIPAGRPVPEHTHKGLELTLVLSGAFSDSSGRYARGDLQEADDDVQHQPHADVGEDCICLAITEAPLRFKSLAARIVQPLLGI
jgi:putative transcriptional regulator